MKEKLLVWIPTVGAVGCMAFFAATLMPYFSAHRSGSNAGYVPLILGAVAASGLAAFVTYALAPSGQYRVARAVGSGITVAVSFGSLFLFVVLNTLGS